MDDAEEEWRVDAAAMSQFTKMFTDACSAQGAGVDRLGKAEAGALLSMSGLPVPTLLQIWVLADVDGDDRLDLKEYLLCCWLVQRTVQKQLPPPTSLPQQLLESVAAAVGPMGAVKQVDDATARSPAEAQRRADAEQRARAQAELEAEEEAARAEAEAKARAEAAARARAEAAAKAEAEAEEEKARAQAEARAHADAEMARAEAEARSRAEAVAANVKAQAQAQAQAEAQAAVAEAEAKARAEAEAAVAAAEADRAKEMARVLAAAVEAHPLSPMPEKERALAAAQGRGEGRGAPAYRETPAEVAARLAEAEAALSAAFVAAAAREERVASVAGGAVVSAEQLACVSCGKAIINSGVAFAPSVAPSAAASLPGAKGRATSTAASEEGETGGHLSSTHLYCETCHPLRLGPACRGCGKPTPKAEAVVALDAVWHRGCMRCEEPGCGKRLADGYFEWQGGLRCREHFLQHGAEQCARCATPWDTHPGTPTRGQALRPTLGGDPTLTRWPATPCDTGRHTTCPPPCPPPAPRLTPGATSLWMAGCVHWAECGTRRASRASRAARPWARATSTCTRASR